MKFDGRSLAVFRAILGIAVLWICLSLSRDVRFYEADGLLPSSGSLIDHFALGRSWAIGVAELLLVGILPLGSLLLILGQWTRWVSAVCFLALVLVQNLNPEILQGGDILLRLLLFWSIFLPLSQTWSLDSRRRSECEGRSITYGYAACAYTLQICLVYWFAGLLKTDPLWNRSGDALFYALSLEHFTTPFGLYLRNFPEFLRCLTFGTRVFEFLGPWLLFVPDARARFLVVILFVGFHLIGMELLLRIGSFPWICAVAWIPFIPSFFWDFLCCRKKDGTSVVSKSREKRSTKAQTVAVKKFKSSAFGGRLGVVIIFVAVIDILAWNIASLNQRTYRLLEQWNRLDVSIGLAQRWNMYAPFPKSVHGWIVVPADLLNGSRIDLFTEKEITYEKPANIAEYLGDFRWRRYLSNLWDAQRKEDLQQYARFLAKRWNQRHSTEQRVQTVSIIFMEQRTRPDLTISQPTRKVLYFSQFE